MAEISEERAWSANSLKNGGFTYIADVLSLIGRLNWVGIY